jgi:ribosome-binding factor A
MESQQHKKLHELSQLCTEIRPDDGLTPLQWKKQHTSRKRSQQNVKRDRHLAAVRDTLDSLIALDPNYDGLQIETIDATRPASLCVVITARGLPPEQATAVEQRLQANEGSLRAALAQELHRKRTPHLRFCVIGT